MSIAQTALREIAAARAYTLHLLSDVPDEHWLRQPREGVTHIAWQVGHLALAEYRLVVDRLGGAAADASPPFGPEFAGRYGRESVPDADPAHNTAPAELRSILAEVHQRVLAEVPRHGDADLQGATDKPHPLFTTKEGALFWCARHEMLHAGQIGLLKRLLGQRPLW